MVYEIKFRGITPTGRRETANGKRYDALKGYALKNNGKFTSPDIDLIVVSFTTPEALAAFINDTAEICKLYQES
jgi:hypothetical protein